MVHRRDAVARLQDHAGARAREREDPLHRGTPRSSRCWASPSKKVRGVKLRDTEDRRRHRACAIDGVFIAIGHKPNTEYLKRPAAAGRQGLRHRAAGHVAHQRRGRVRGRRRARLRLPPGGDRRRHRLHGRDRRERWLEAAGARRTHARRPRRAADFTARGARPPMEREVLEFDVQFVGAGPAGLAGAIHLANLIARHDQAVAAGAPGKPIGEINDRGAREGGRRSGAHGISGAVMDPRAMRELMPDFASRAARSRRRDGRRRVHPARRRASSAAASCRRCWTTTAITSSSLGDLTALDGGHRRAEGRAGRHRDAGRDARSSRTAACAACSPATRASRRTGEHKPHVPARRRLPREGHRAVRGPARHAHQGSSSSSSGSPWAAILRSTRPASRKSGRCRRAARRRAASSTPWAGRCPTTRSAAAFIYGMSDTHVGGRLLHRARRRAIRPAIRTRICSASRRTRWCARCSRAASRSRTAPRRSPRAAGSRCRSCAADGLLLCGRQRAAS